MARLPRWSSWVLWFGILAVVTFVMHRVRGNIEQAHVVLPYLLIVLGASAHGGRRVGLTLSLSCLLLLDYFFQAPYDRLSVAKPPDLLVLLAFLATSAVTTQLLTRAQQDATRARRRADEVAQLSRLGSETLSAGRAEDALHAVAGIIRETLRVSECAIFATPPEGEPTLAAMRTVDHELPLAHDPELVRWVAGHGRAVAVRADGTSRLGEPGVIGAEVLGGEPDIRTLLLPLLVHGRSVGVLRLAASHTLTLDVAQRRFLSALAYYAALGVERVRLVAEAEHAEALREADRLKDVVLASVSHDLRTPLTTIKALADDAAAGGDENARIIGEQADRLGRIVTDLLDLSRIKGQALPVSPELNTAEDLLGAAMRQLGPLVKHRRVVKAIDYTQPALLGRFDFVQSLRIICNLIENALRYSPPESVVEVIVRREGDALVFAVADRGPGVPPAERERIFEPFYRPVGTPPDTGGAGLGLAIARRLAEAQGGSVRYESRPGGGSIFALRVPAADLGTAEHAAILANT